MARTSIREVAVIGAGASGIAAARCLLDEGIAPTVFERSGRIGGIWSFDEALADGGGPAYRSLHTNTPKQITAFSDHPFREDLPDFPPAAEVAGYLAGYARHFGVREHIHFDTRVDEIAPAEGGRWSVRATSPRGEHVGVYDAVFVCSGMFGEPLMPRVPGLEGFGGTVLHSRAYTDARPFAGQRVLVMGTGSSGVDIAAEVAQVARRVWLSGRDDAWKRASGGPLGRPAGWRSRLARHARLRLGLSEPRPAGYAARTDAAFTMQRDHPILSAPLREAVEAGTVARMPGVERMDGARVVFADGSSEEVDAIVCATGYALRFPFLDEGIFRATPDGLGLYRAVFHPDRPTLAFIGMSRATGAILPFAEMQARWAARVLTGAIALPGTREMHASIEARRRLVAEQGGNPYRIEYEPYMDTLASEIGALPKLSRHPGLWRALLWGKPLAARYRLDGPGRSPDAARILRWGNNPPRRTASAPGRFVEDRSLSRG
jgi:dimethylaniline monooxygenase (N-oxide forming)